MELAEINLKILERIFTSPHLKIWHDVEKDLVVYRSAFFSESAIENNPVWATMLPIGDAICRAQDQYFTE